ncbi:RNA polymerase sigma factor SigZ [Roseibium sp. SCP14]|uniref:RNA polymerase sigma factor SigZ n=1 Tax=Roseibium sp. SCP14 TaxID=3141375 RepID=UPI0033390603
MQTELERVWVDYRSSLNAFLRSKVSNPADVEELLQDILLKTHRNIGKLGKDDSLKAWLFQVANNATIDFYRKKAKTKALDPEELWYSDMGDAEKHDLDQCIEPFIDALPEDMRILLRKIELEGVSQKQYAQDLGISYSTLKSRVQKARSRLRNVYDSCCHFSLDAQGNIVGYRSKSDSCGKC